jgi:VWFA-related protein
VGGLRRRFPILAAGLAAALAAAGAAGSSPPAADAEPGAYELLERVREAYSGLLTYRDRGALEITRAGDAGATRVGIRTEYVRDGRFELTLTPPAPAAPRTLVREAAGASDPAPFAAELRAALEPYLGAATDDALVAQSLLALGSAAVPDPEAAGIEGADRCGEATCRILSGSRSGGREAFRFWVGVGDDLVRRVDLELAPAPGAAGGATRVRVDLAPEARAGAPSGAAAAAQGAQEPPAAAFSEQLEVALSTVVVRVLDDRGDPVPDLEPKDFRVRVGRQEVAPESADWIGSNVAADSLLEAGTGASGDLGEPPPPRLLVFFVQADFEPSRMSGQVRMLAQAKRLVDDLRIDDRAAVVSYDTHLKLRQDFTDDHERLREALDAAIRFGREPWIRPGREPSLARHFERADARAATTPERGLELTARALIPIPGDKIVVYLGWGLGELTPLGVEMIPAYFDALRALRAAHAAVFVLDVTDADYHSLEVGLEKVAADTGGTYSKTHQFPVGATDRLLHLVAGYYLIGFHRPAGAEPGAEVRIELRDPRRGTLVQGK